jgi:hypothetical protein
MLLEDAGLSDASSVKSNSASPRAAERLCGVTAPLPGCEEYPGGGVSGCGISVTEGDFWGKLRVRASAKDWRSEFIVGRRFDTSTGSTL